MPAFAGMTAERNADLTAKWKAGHISYAPHRLEVINSINPNIIYRINTTGNRCNCSR